MEGVARGGTGVQDDLRFVIVWQLGDNFLLYQNLAADGAVRPFGQAGLSAGGGNGFVNDLGVGLEYLPKSITLWHSVHS